MEIFMTAAEAFCKKASLIHNNVYGYQHVIYINAKSKVIIHCYAHGPFTQTANNHLNGQGCPQCALQRKLDRIRQTALTTEEFIARAHKIHQHEYKYHNTKYVASNKPVVITCTTHGDFVVKRAEKHLNGQGCPQCSVGSRAETIIQSWLASNGVMFLRQHTFDDCESHTSGRKLPFDFFVPLHNMLIEYDGEQHTKKSPLFHPGDRFERLQQHDNIKTQYANANNITLVRIPHTKFDQIRDILEQHIE